MTRKPRDYTNHLRAFWKRRFPDRLNTEIKEFSDEVLCAVDMIMYQLDPTGAKPVLLPIAYAEGAEPSPSVKTSGKRGRAKE